MYSSFRCFINGRCYVDYNCVFHRMTIVFSITRLKLYNVYLTPQAIKEECKRKRKYEIPRMR